jgi:hypothetical protein
MGKRLAILVAVERYLASDISSVRYAEADAVGFADALELGGAVERVTLLSPAATRTSIKSKIRQHVGSLTSDDEMFLFYAGHGFSKNGHNFITCYDTDRNDLENTSIRLKDLLETCGKSGCKRIVFFLDSCESGITDLPEIRGIYATMSDSELQQFFEDAEYRACFASCKTSESSYSAPALKHGVWTHNVIRALEGSDRLALEKGRYVTAMSLQNYLKKQIPRTLRDVFSAPKVQTPWFYGSQTGDFVISDLGVVLAERNAVKPGYEQVKQLFLQVDDSVAISSLSGFSKRGGHRVPDGVNSATRRFVENISEKEINDDIEEVFERIRDSMKYKRRDMVAEVGRIVTPDFEYVVSVSQDRDDPSMAVISRQLLNISPKVVDDDAFNAVFDDTFDELTFGFTAEINVRDLIDQIEDLDLDKISLEYPSDCSNCKITIKGSPLTIQVTPHGCTVHNPEPVSPRMLVESFFTVQKQLTGSPVLRAIAGK